MSAGMVRLFAVAAGLAVANIYYAQPLLTAIAAEFGVGSGTASSLVTVTTAGYAFGLGLVVPLADVLDRRRLVAAMLAAVALIQAAAAVAPSMLLLAVVSAVLAPCAVVAPIMVAFAATLAEPARRGQVTGSVMSGVLVGVLLARTGGGLVADLAGSWRAVYAAAAVLMAVLAAVLWRVLPDVRVADRLRYGALLRSVVTIVREEPVLRLRCAYGFLSFAGFSAFWATTAFLLAGEPYRFGPGVIGAFGLLGAVGAVAARVTGRFVDRGRGDVVTGALLGVVLLSWGLMALGGGRWIVPLVLGVVALDLGVQGVQVANLTAVYQLRPEARSRITMAYTGTYFLGGAVGAGASGAAYAAAGWPAVCGVGGLLAAAALALWAVRGRSVRVPPG
ncbi:MFS transporter [Actinokineospora terrae]|uniref:Predicted arabinose efflux permease, MFS family n=1 Tax=Actinokineospora terrae TaxID=155974 RepID=A0A1H9LNM6_9PSEU|nr:MFS transporter [Actinokineospora terrae]SER13034.1 Predicted arabinose efflux permease, MFS family [Actinokineospora terrae]